MKRLRTRFWKFIYEFAAARIDVERTYAPPHRAPLGVVGDQSDAAVTADLLRIAGWTVEEVDEVMPAIAQAGSPVYRHALRSLLASRKYVQ